MIDLHRQHHAEGSLRFVRRHFPGLVAHVGDAQACSLGYGVGDGVCARPELADKKWFRANACKSRRYEDMPDGFRFIGIQNRGSMEYLVAMWREGDRRFWLYDCYVCFVAETDTSTERTNKVVEEALARWRKGEKSIVYSGPHGGWVDGNQDEHGIDYL